MESMRVSVFKALADEKRLGILEMIRTQPDICACTILETYSMSQSTLSHHMKLLCEAKLVSCDKRGKWVHYELNDEGFNAIARYAKDMLHD